MATIKGQNLRVLLSPNIITTSSRCIAAATTCTAHLALQIQEDTTKDTDDDWVYNEPVGINWDIQTEALVVSDDDEEYRDGAVAADQLQIGQVYYLEFVRTLGAAGGQNRDVAVVGHHFHGYAILNDLTFTAQNGEQSVARAQFTGTGVISDEYISGT